MVDVSTTTAATTWVCTRGVSKKRNDACSPLSRCMGGKGIADWDNGARKDETRSPMPMLFLVVAVLGFLLAANANHPIPIRAIGIPSFFSGWLISELAPQHLVAHVLVTVALIAAGSVEGAVGWTA